MTEKPRVYLAGPIQHSVSHGKGWRGALKNSRSDFEWVDPIDKYDPTKTYDEIEREWSSADIVEEDLELLHSCDGVLVHWEDVPSVGTPMEMVYAKEKYNIPVVVQTTVEEPSIWLTEHADAVVDTFDEAIEELESLTAMSKEDLLWEAFGV